MDGVEKTAGDMDIGSNGKKPAQRVLGSAAIGFGRESRNGGASGRRAIGCISTAWRGGVTSCSTTRASLRAAR